MTQDEYRERFKARMIAVAGETFDDGDSISAYADMAAQSYFDDVADELTPEEAADEDMSLWGS